ncbi:MAG: hypothetical protein RQ847_02505 [Wenzhouxiangellaceae bacterium]|nr:hypothetical protein [Wenzhouxiangellaceae bacterium]
MAEGVRSDAFQRLKIDSLSDPSCYPHPVGRVETIETHLSWVFLAGAFAYKLKKPVIYDHLDLRSLDSRYENSIREVALNRRLAPDVYVGAIPLVMTPSRVLRLECEGETVDWLVRMHRLPGDRMLDRMLDAGRATRADVERVIRLLATFYRRATPAVTRAEDYDAALRRTLASNREALTDPAFEACADGLDDGPAALLDAQQSFLGDHADVFARRVERGRIVEGHGDLRPEHVCLTSPPVIYDCLDFSRALRVADAADELSFLALECERLGFDWVDPVIWQCYAEAAGDRPPRVLVAFYKSVRACTWARLALGRTRELAREDWQPWLEHANSYLKLAGAHLPQ